MEQHIESVLHLKKKLDKGVSFEKTMHILYKLQKIPITIKLLEETGIGFKVRELSKQQKNNDIGKTAKLLTMNWKDYVRNKQQQQQENADEDDESEEVEHESPNFDNSNNWNNKNSGSPAYSSPNDIRANNNYYSSTNGGTFDDDQGAICEEVTPRSERSEESVCGNSSGGHKKKHKKKKKKSSNREEDSDEDNNEEVRKDKKKDKKDKKRYRESNNDSDDSHNRDSHKHRRATSSSSASKSNEINCDNKMSYDSKSDYSKKLKIKEEVPVASSSLSSKYPTNSQNSSSHKAAATSQECDIFGTLLGMNDQIIKGSSSAAVRPKAQPVPVITRASKPSTSSSSMSSMSSHKPSPAPNGNHLNHHSLSKSSSSSPVKSQTNDRFDILKSLPDPNYRPPPVRNDFMYQEINTSGRTPAPQPPKHNDLNKMLMAGLKMKGRTAVYAGTSKTLGTVTEVFPLHDLCLRVLMNHIDRIYEVGDLPYYILKPVLTKCSVSQLRRIEYYNPQLLEETDELWQEFCIKDFKNRHIDDSNYFTWREFHEHLMNEREEKLKNITRSISSKQRKAVPERKTQQIELKTPREVRRKLDNSARFASYSSSRGGGGGGGGFGSRSLGSSSHGSSSSSAAVTIVNSKPKTAPLMKKLLQFRKGKFNRK